MIYCFDIDGTLCTNTNGNYEDAKPCRDVIERMNRLYAAGHRIVLHSARGSTTGIDWRAVTQCQLSDWGVHYHELTFGKPSADVYVDDKAVSLGTWCCGGQSQDESDRDVSSLAQPGRQRRDDSAAAERQVYLNGSFVPESEAKISIYDSALMYGDMVFEMMRTFNKGQFRLRQHLERLYASIKYLRIPLKMTVDEMERVFYEVIHVNAPLFDDQDEIRSLINVSRGPLEIYRHIFDGLMEPTVVIACFPLKWVVAHMAKFYDTGVHAVIPSQRAMPAQLLDVKVKSRSRIFYQVANLEAAQVDRESWALLLDPDGFIAEGTGSNFFLVKEGVLYTPEPRNILRGVSRQYVMELARRHGIQCVEKNLDLYDLFVADEGFFTCTPFSIMPATRINGAPIGTGRVGKMTADLMSWWSEEVGVDFATQAKAYAKDLGLL